MTFLNLCRHDLWNKSICQFPDPNSAVLKKHLQLQPHACGQQARLALKVCRSKTIHTCLQSCLPMTTNKGDKKRSDKDKESNWLHTLASKKRNFEGNYIKQLQIDQLESERRGLWMFLCLLHGKTLRSLQGGRAKHFSLTYGPKSYKTRFPSAEYRFKKAIWQRWSQQLLWRNSESNQAFPAQRNTWTYTISTTEK